ncbi:MAG: hypothetical protein IKV99_00700 [Oscillospiraceae bacterium]|nr:hypothetical protein [Oscillospiraceae bacterium]
MERFLNTIKEKVAVITAPNKPEDDALFAVNTADVTAESSEYAYYLCHPTLGSLLRFGWAQADEDDTTAINIALLYCAYAGFVTKMNEAKGVKIAPQELYEQLMGDKRKMGVEWVAKAYKMLGIDEKSDLAQQLDEYFEDCRACCEIGLPEHVGDQQSEITCVNACIAMFFVGKGVEVK